MTGERGGLLGGLIVGASWLGHFALRWLRDRGELAASEEARVLAASRTKAVEQEVLDGSFRSLKELREFMDARFKEIISSQETEIRSLREEVGRLRLEVARLASIERHCQELEGENARLRQRLRGYEGEPS